MLAEATKVDPDVIEDIYTILVALSCTQDICPDKLKVVCYNLFTKLTNRYYWHKIPQAIHKMIFHSHQVIRYNNLPLGCYSEEAQEASNKLLKSYREHYTRKSSRLITNYDLIVKLLVNSDPIITNMQRSGSKDITKPDHPESMQLLLK